MDFGLVHNLSGAVTDFEGKPTRLTLLLLLGKLFIYFIHLFTIQIFCGTGSYTLCIKSVGNSEKTALGGSERTSKANRNGISVLRFFHSL